MEEERFNAHKEEFQLEVLQQLQAEGIRKEGAKLSYLSPLISDTYIVDGATLLPDDFIPDSVATDPTYEDNILVKNQYSLEYQEINNKTGKRKLAWKESATLILISTPSAICKCEDTLVFLKGKKTPLRFPNGEISEEAFKRQTPFARKGINVSVKRHYESFLRNLRECPNKKFLTIPKHAGGVTLPNGVTTYISAESVIPGLEDLFPTEVKEHRMVVHELPLKDTVAIYRKALPNCVAAKLATTIRDETILLPLFGAEGLHPDRGFSISYNNDSVRETVIALTKRKNYASKNNWGEFAKAQDKHIIVISTGADGVEKGSEIIDIMLESLYGYKQCHPYEKYTVVIDEAQDLYLHEKGAVNTLLRKGGKHGVTMLLASQSYPDSTTPFGKVVGNCGRVRGYRSKGDDLARYADRFGCDKYEADSLQKGNCIDNGPFYSRYRCENVITTLKGRTVVFEHAPNNDKNDDEQPCGCSEGGENDG